VRYLTSLMGRWFFGDISRIEAESRLRAANKGSFLIRFRYHCPSFSFLFFFFYFLLWVE